MSRKKDHRMNLHKVLAEYARQRGLEFSEFTIYHLRITDPGYTEIDCWSTGKYYIRKTNYHELAPGTVERGSEKGYLPDDDYLPMWLDKIFYPGVTP